MGGNFCGGVELAILIRGNGAQRQPDDSRQGAALLAHRRRVVVLLAAIQLAEQGREGGLRVKTLHYAPQFDGRLIRAHHSIRVSTISGRDASPTISTV